MSEQYLKTFVFVLRLSAIGDFLIAAKSVRSLKERGYEPIVITMPLLFDLTKAMPDLNLVGLYDAKSALQFYRRKSPESVEFERIADIDFAVWISATGDGATRFKVLDFQNTGRSRRAFKALKQTSNRFTFKRVAVAKHTLYRVFLVILAYLYFSQKRSSAHLDSKKILRVSREQKKLIATLPLLRESKSSEDVFSKRFLQLLFRKETEPLLPVSPYVVLFPGASYFLKEWPKENFRKLLFFILEKTDLKIVLCGAKEEGYLGSYLAHSPNARVTNLIGKTTLPETLSLIASAQYLVSGDSFAMHAADAMKTPATVIYGPTSPKFGFLPESEHILLRYAELKCSPCTRHGQGGCRFKNLRCMTSTKAEDVFVDVINSGKI